MENKIKFERKIGMKGEVLAVSIPQELIGYLNIKNGEIMCISPESGKHGKYLTMWLKKE